MPDADYQQWEYLFLADPDVNEMGRRGWELCAAFTVGMGVVFHYFKRPLHA